MNFCSLAKASEYIGFSKGYISGRLKQGKKIKGYDIYHSKDVEELERETLSFRDTDFIDLMMKQIERENKAYKELVESLGYEPEEIIIEKYPLNFEEGKDGSMKVWQSFRIRYRDKKGAMKYFERNKNQK